MVRYHCFPFLGSNESRWLAFMGRNSTFMIEMEQVQSWRLWLWDSKTLAILDWDPRECR